MNLYTIYDWITSLLRTGSGGAFYKALEETRESVVVLPSTELASAAGQQQHKRAVAPGHKFIVQNVDVEFVPTLNFVFKTPANKKTAAVADGEQEQVQQHVADDCSDNESTHTYIISRSSLTAATSCSSSTPYAVTSTDTSELLRQQNNLSLTEDEHTISSFSIEPPTSSMTIEMAEHHTTATTATTTTTSSNNMEARPTTVTTTTDTTSSSIEEDIEEAIELSEVEEQLNSNIESLSEAAAFARPKQIESQIRANNESSEEAAEFRIDDAQLSGGQLAQHFVVDDEESEDGAEPNSPKDQATLSEENDDFDISLPLENIKAIHSRHDDFEIEPEVEVSFHGQEEGESLNNQSTTDDVSDFVDEPQHASESAVEADEEQAQSPAASTAISQSRLEESELDTAAEPHSEQDHSMEEIVHTNESIEVTYDGEEAAASSTLCSASQKLEMITDLDVPEPAEVHSVVPLSLPQLQQSQMVEQKSVKLLETLQLLPESQEQNIEDKNDDDEDEDDDDDDDEAEEADMQLLKLRLLAMHQQTPSESNTKTSPTESPASHENTTIATSNVELKQMERIPLTEFSKDVLEDITEESERLLSLSTTAEDPKSLSMEETKTLQECKVGGQSNEVSLNTLKELEAKVQDLNSQLETKDNYLASLNMQLETARRESSAGPASARDSSSLMTTSTEYRTFQEEFGAPTLDIYLELSRRDDIIAKLTESLQNSLSVRGKLQTDSDRLSEEVQALRKQLQESIDTVKRSSGWSDREVNVGGHISEISMDLISESDDELDRNYLTDQEECACRSSRERQMSVPRQSMGMDDIGVEPLPPEWPPAFSKQIEQFQKFLLPGELRPFLLVQRKFDDYLTQQLSQCREQTAQELQTSREQWEKEKLAKEKAQQAAHTKQMEELRKYFEHRCADLEKQFSDDIFSHKSQHVGSDTSSECSEVEQLPDEMASKESSPRKRKRAELLLSPSHREITPSGLEALGEKVTKDNMSLEIADLKVFYQTHIHELKRTHAEEVCKLNERLRFHERRHADDDYLSTPKPPRTCQKANQDTIDVSPVPAQNPNSSLIIIDEDELNFKNESQVIQRIIEEYERRLQEQLALARQDIATELEQQIQSLLSDNAVNDQHWPKELILLREKFTAKSQLEITQLNIKHAEEMSRIKLDYEKQLNRKNKRHLTFDSGRDLDHIINERDGLRELSKSFRSVLCRLAKCVANCEVDLNATLSEEMQRILAQGRSQEAGDDLEHTLSSSLLQGSLNNTKQLRVPDVHSLLEVVEDPSLVQFIDSKSPDDINEDFDLGECLERLKSEAAYLLRLSEDLDKHNVTDPLDETEKQEHEQCCEAEDGLKTTAPQPPTHQQLLHELLRTNSLNDQHLGEAHKRKTSHGVQITKTHSSLPLDLQQHAGNASELSFQLIELKNRLIKSETDRQNLQQQLTNTIDRNTELGQELEALRDQLSQLNSLNHTDYAEGYGLGDMKTPKALDQSSASFVQLQERARHLLTSPTQKQQSPSQEKGNSTVVLLQMIEDFCREGDKVVELGKKDREDLQAQIDTADKQLKATRQFLEEQAGEREQERDEFQREIEQLKMQLRDKEKERSSFANASEEYAQLEVQLKEVNLQLGESNAKRDKFEVELKASIDKIFVLREIISELETQVQTKALNEQVLDEKAKQLEDYVQMQMRSNDALQKEVHSLKTDIGEGYQTRIQQLEEKLQQGLPSADHSVAEQLRDIESTLEQKTKTLESLHNSNTASNSCSLSATEDVSVHGGNKQPTGANTAEGSPTHHSLTVEGVQRVAEKLERHTRVEEAAIKRIRDLEMQVTQLRSGCVELQHERDSLQGRIDEQSHRISSLQKRLEEQRQRAEELHRTGTSDLNTRVHELQGEVRNMSEQLVARDKQMATMQQQLQRSKDEIARLESELAARHQPDRSRIESLEADVQHKSNELHKLRETIRTEMINRQTLPDLMQAMLADKNDEIDHLQEQLQARERELQAAKDASPVSSPAAGKQDASTKHSARTLSDIGSITEFPEPDVDRRATMRSLNAPLQLPESAVGFLYQTMETSKEAVANLTYKRTDDLSGFVVAHPANTFEHPHYFQDPNAVGVNTQISGDLTPGLVPRQINFSNLTEDSKMKTPGLLIQTPELPKAITSPELQQLKQKLTALEEEKQQQKTELEQNLNQLTQKLAHEKEQLGKQQKLVRDHEEGERKYRQRIIILEERILETAALEAAERETLRKELNLVSAAHAQCEQHHQQIAETRKQEVETLNAEIRAKSERNRDLVERLQLAQERCEQLERQVHDLEHELKRLKNSEQSSKQYSVDEIAQQVEMELNYSAQLDSNILKAIESEEENNLDSKLHQKEVQTDANPNGHGTDDENFTGERELLNQLEAVRAQLAVEREQTESLSQQLLGEKHHSQEIQEQDVLIIEAMRKRLEAVLEAEDELHKQLDMERERCERLQTQLTSLQRAESRRSSSMLKSPTDSPRKSPRADFDSELCERLRSELKLLTAQNERERERSADAQRNSDRERQRYEKELQERVAYCERLKQEMDKLARDKESAELEVEHFNERLTLQANEIESLESRLVTLQETETRRANTRARQHQEEAKLQAEIHELKSKLMTAESTKENLDQKINQLRFDVARSAQREAKLSEALAQANDRLAHSTDDVPAQFLQKMKDINTLLAENTQENRQMAETVQYLVGERIALQKKCEELGSGNATGNANANELEERCRQLLGRYLRVESHRKALVYQKRYLKLTLESYQASEQLALQNLAGAPGYKPRRVTKKKLFKTVALAIIAIQRIKYIGRIWHTGKRIVSKSVFTITQQRSGPCLNLNVPASPLPVVNQNVNLNGSMPSNSNITERINYVPASPSHVPAVNFSSLQPIVLTHDYTLQTPTLLKNNHGNHSYNNTNSNNNNNNNNNKNESSLPTLTSLDWPTSQKAKRVHSRHH